MGRHPAPRDLVRALGRALEQEQAGSRGDDAIRQRLYSRVLRTDVLRKRAAGRMPGARLPPIAYTPEAQAETYGALAAAADRCLSAGHGVIVDAVFGSQAERELIQGVGADDGVPFVGIWLTAPPELLSARVASRAGDASDADPAVVEAQLRRGIAPPPGWSVIESGGTLEAVLTAARQALAAAASGGP